MSRSSKKGPWVEKRLMKRVEAPRARMAALDLRPRSLACEARHAPSVLDQLALRARGGVVHGEVGFR